MDDLASSLPSTLQLPQLKFICAVCLGAVFACRTFPDRYRKPWIVQLITQTVGSAVSMAVIGVDNWHLVIYGLGTGLICASLSTAFYDLAFRAIEDKIRAFLGQPSSPDVEEPLRLPPKPTTPTQKDQSP